MSALLAVRDLQVRYPVARRRAPHAGARPAFVDVLPRTAAGKVLKRELRQHFAD